MREGLQSSGAEWTGHVGIRIVPRGVSREVTFSRAHHVDPFCNELAQTHEGKGAC